MAKIGKCTNRVGCTLAYTGQEIRFEGAPVCPECGQPLTEIPVRKKGSKVGLLILIPVVFLVIAGLGFYLAERYVIGPDGGKSSPSPQSTAPKSDTGQKMVEGKSQVPADVLNKANQTPSVQANNSPVTPGATPSSETAQQTPPSPKENPSVRAAETPPQNQPSETEGGGTPPSTQETPPNTEQSPANQKGPPAQTPGAHETVDTKPKELSPSDVETIKQDVLKRINALPKMSEGEKSKLADKVETARYMQRVGIVYFEKGSSTLSRASIDKLVAMFKAHDLVEKMSDPTLVFIVAGYADTGGDAKVNLKLSDERAQAVTNALVQNAGVINLVRTIGMGGTDLLNSKRADENRAVEVWAVIP